MKIVCKANDKKYISGYHSTFVLSTKHKRSNRFSSNSSPVNSHEGAIRNWVFHGRPIITKIVMKRTIITIIIISGVVISRLPTFFRK